jgi:predicted Zn-dependent protease
MGISYARLTATAQRLISANGRSATYTRVVSTSYDPIADVEVRSILPYAVNVVLTPLKVGDLRPDLAAIAETLVTASVSTALIADLPVGVQPQPSDTLRVDGTGTGSGLWTVRGATAVQPSGDAVVFLLLLERAAGAT